jgi:hypothetical protein
VLPGNVHDLAAARENVLSVLRPFLGEMPVLADPGYEGAGHGVHVPVKKPAGVRELDIDTRARNALGLAVAGRRLSPRPSDDSPADAAAAAPGTPGDRPPAVPPYPAAAPASTTARRSVSRQMRRTP